MVLTNIPLADLFAVAMTRPGMKDDFLASGEIDGIHLTMERTEFDRLQEKWFPGVKLGTMIHNAIVETIGVFSSDAASKAEDCGGCAGRELKINAATN